MTADATSTSSASATRSSTCSRTRRRVPRRPRPGEGRDDAHRDRAGRGAVRRHGPGHRDVGRLGGQHDRRRGQLRRARPPTSAGSTTTSSARCSPTTCGRSGVHFHDKPATEGPPTGRCLIVVTPDAQRTMNTYLGASALLRPGRRRRRPGPAGARSRSSRATCSTGPSRRRPTGRPPASPTTPGARWRSRLSDLFCVERHHDDFLPLVRERVDILFANESEACALWGCDEVDAAVERARAEVAIACITLRRQGLGRGRGRRDLRGPGPARSTVVDTTGAGDLYAAGFLYGYTHGPLAARVRPARLAGGGRGHRPHRRPPRVVAGVSRRADAGRPQAASGRRGQRANWWRGATFRITRSDWIGLPVVGALVLLGELVDVGARLGAGDRLDHLARGPRRTCTGCRRR